MALHDELLELSFALSGSTKQAYRRRSVSSAYYALFHRLAHESSSLFFPEPPDALLHAATTRALDHKTMSNVCQGFAGLSVLKGQIQQLLGSTEIPEDLRSVSRLFFELQVARHRRGLRYTRRVYSYRGQEILPRDQAGIHRTGQVPR